MGKREPMTSDQIEGELRALGGWTHEQDCLRKSFTFGDFREAMSFLVRVSYYADSMDHHPEIHNVYNRVDLSLSTHDAGDRVTQMDFDLARAIDRFSWV
jgi:4a-hydroxytetrahydrobiopterin dehydratase